MKSILSIFLIILTILSNCMTPQPAEKTITPNFNSGCSEYRGANRTKCIQGLLRELEYLRDPKNPIEKKITETRYDSYWVYVETEYCPSKNFCWVDSRYDYKPSLLIRIRDYTLIGAVGVAVGYILGIP